MVILSTFFQEKLRKINKMIWENNIIKSNKIEFDISIWEPEHLVWLNNFIIPKNKRKNGLGKQIMKEFSKWLDENHYESELLISNCYGTPEPVLQKFYGNYGYTEIKKKGNNTYLIRKYIDKK